MSDLYTISSSVLPYSARVVGFRGTETLSRPYHFEIFIQLRQELGEEFDLADAIGAKAKLVVERDHLGIAPFYFAGIFGNIEVLHAYDGHLLIRAHLVPRLWQLSLSRHSRLFTKMKIPDIITTILEENGITDYELRLGGYEVEEHVTQYRESDLDFISRWMEKEGIYYYFEHSDDGEKLILSDNKAYDEDPQGKPVRYFPQLGTDHSAGAHFRSFTAQQTTLPASVRLKDYDYAKPSLNVQGTAMVASNGAGEVSLYGERFWTPGTGERYAKLRAEELLARQAVYHAKGTRLHMRPGYAFELEDHPFASFNTKYLTIEARHSGNQSAALGSFRELIGIGHDDVYQVEVFAIPAKTQFRAESLTAWPRIYGYENGLVDGPAESEYAQIDEMGRYKAKFKFDEGTLKGGKATTWVRMMQPHGGSVEGFHFPLRKGTEVVFVFLDGDPDRPVLFGIVPNAVKPSPVTSSNHTRNVIQTGSYNRVEMEDLSGGQWMHLSTPAQTTHLFMGTIGECDHNFVLETQGTGHLHTVGKWDVNVEGTLNETVVGNVTELYESNTSQTVDGHKTHLVLSGETETVLAGFTQTILAFSTRYILGPYTETLIGAHTHTHVGALDRTRMGTTTETLVGDVTRNITGTVTDTVSADVSWTVGGDVSWGVSGKVEWNVADKIDFTSSEYKCDTGPVTIEASGPHMEIKADISTEIVGGIKTEIFGGAQLEITAGDLLEVVAGIQNSLALGMFTELTMGVKNEFNLAATTEFTPFVTELKAVKDGAHGVKLSESGEETTLGGPWSALRALCTLL